MAKEPIPVVPAAHYQCGGVLTNVDGETDIAGLYAVGEVACTGLARRQPAGQQFAAGSPRLRPPRRRTSRGRIPSPPLYASRRWQSGNAHNADEMVVVSHNWDEIRRVMWDYVGIVRTNKRLQRAQQPHRQPAGGNPGVLLGFHRDQRPAGIAQHRHGGRVDRRSAPCGVRKAAG